MMNRRGYDRQPQLVLSHKVKAFSISWLSIVFVVGFFYRWLFGLRKFSFITSLLCRVLLPWKSIESYQFVSASMETIIWFLPSILLLWWITLFNFLLLNQPCLSGMSSTGFRCIIFFIYCYIWMTILLFGYCTYVLKCYWHEVLFLVISLIDF